MTTPHNESTWVEISRDNLRHNINETRKLLQKGTGLFAVVKSNAYGHGMTLISNEIENIVDGFCVANTTEAIELRNSKIKKRIIVLSYFTTHNNKHFKNLHEGDIEIPIHTFAQLELLKKSRLPLQVHVKFDIGTSRIGFKKNDLQKLITKLKNSRLKIMGLYSHFADVEDMTSNYSNTQLESFDNIKKAFLKIFPNATPHMACSAGVLRLPEAHFGIVRLGIHVYGLTGLPEPLNEDLSLKPVLRWKARIIQSKKVTKGTPIGYNQAFKPEGDTTIITLPIGYWDGYSRSLSNIGVIIKGENRANIRGNICMNVCMAEPDGHSDQFKEGDIVDIIGPNISATTLANLSKTINYEIVTGINPSIPRYLV